jgi:hypothetical protein
MTCAPGTSASAAASRCEVCEAGTFAAESGAEVCTSCPAGFVTTGQGSSALSSCVCPRGTVLALGAQGPHSMADCSQCPVYMECPAGSDMKAFVVGKGVLRLLPRYMTLAGKPEQVYACRDQRDCPVGMPGECGPLRDPTSVACGDCMPGAYESADACEHCGSVGAVEVALLVVAALAAIAVPGVFALMTNRDVQYITHRSIDMAVIASIALTSVQAFGILAQLPVGWFEPVASLLKICGFINLDLEILRIPCFVHLSNASSYIVDLSPVLLGLLSPFVALSLKKARVSRMDFMPEYVNAVGALGTMFFVSITIACLGLGAQKNPQA